MKIFTLSLGLFLSTYFAKAQKPAGIDSIIVEKFYIANAADAANSANNSAIPELIAGKSIAYRVYIDMADGWKFVQLKGNSVHTLKISTTTAFYNDPNNGVTLGAQATSTTNIKKNTVMLDSYLTTGGVAAGKVGVVEEDDTDGSVGNAQSILQNNPSGIYGLPINSGNAVVANTIARDGMISGTPAVNTTLGFDGADSHLDVFTDNAAVGTFSVNTGGMAILGGGLGFGPNNRMLIGQFTTDGDLSFEMNFQLLDPTSKVKEFVANNPTVTTAGIQEEEHFGLTYPVKTNTTTNVKSTNNVSSSSNITIYPNPAKDAFVISINNAEESNNNFYSVYDVKGTLIAHETLGKIAGNYNQTINIKNYASGLYMVSINLNGTMTTKKLIKE